MFHNFFSETSEEDHVKTLRLPLYALFHLKSIDVELIGNCIDSQIPNPKKIYGRRGVRNIKEALNWALANRNYDFNSILPNLGYSNDEIYGYLEKFQTVFLKRLKNPLPYKKKDLRKP